MSKIPPPPLTPEEIATYEWQMWTEGFGARGQQLLKGASVLVTRCGGLGGNVALQLAAAGVGKLVLAHGGVLKESDLNRQTLMTHGHLGKPRIDSIVDRLLAFNPRLEVFACGENVAASNVAMLVGQADVLVDCAPLFEERYLLNAEAVRQGKPMVEAAVFDMEFHLTTIVPGKTACLACLYPERSTAWKRQFPVFGAVSATAGAMAAAETIKLISGLGEPLAGRMLVGDLRAMTFQTVNVRRLKGCEVCGGGGARDEMTR